MKIKSLLIGSAALMTASSGAYAADAIVYADPEPVEYVRVCDVYGTGFFYIPGTETCLKIGGYVRVQVNFTLAPAPTGYNSLARFAPTFDVRSENEWGTLRAFAELEFDYNSGPGATTTVSLNHAFIEQTLGGGTVRLGKTDGLYARFLGYGSGGVYGGNYAGTPFDNRNELSYTFSGNGFSAAIALEDNNANNSWATNVLGGVQFGQGWGSVGAVVGYDAVTTNWGAKGVLRVGPANGFSAGLHVFYSSGPGNYAITGNLSGLVTPWSVMAHARYAFSEKGEVKAHVQWFDNPGVTPDEWEIAGGLLLKPVNGLEILPELRYRTGAGAVNTWAGVIRVNRTF